MTLQQLHDRGFDLSEADGKHHRVRCSRCAADVINGVPCHEQGCPNQNHECRGCEARIPLTRKYCKECL